MRSAVSAADLTAREQDGEHSRHTSSLTVAAAPQYDRYRLQVGILVTERANLAKRVRLEFSFVYPCLGEPSDIGGSRSNVFSPCVARGPGH